MSLREVLMNMRDILVRNALPVLEIVLELWPDKEALKQFKREFTLIKSGPDPQEKKQNRQIWKIEEAYYRHRRKR